MEAVIEMNPPVLPTVTQTPVDPQTVERRREILLDALKMALADGQEHRLFRSGRLDGLFPSKLGDSGEAARQSLAADLLEHVRTEVKGKFIFEWVRATPRAVGFVAEHDSPKAILRELRDVLGETQNGVPIWMEQAKSELRTLTGLFEQRSSAVLSRLESLSERVESALRRAETKLASGPVGTKIAKWADYALEYLDQRKEGRLGPCPLGELFHAISERFESITIPEVHDGVRRLAEVRALKLTAGFDGIREPEFAVLYEGKLNQFADR